ncbi:MAG TPA: DsbA family protein [Solirubrobacteraceae bacterium]|jgi:2-hydroxychromene-2-carboxylate isomerase|nr:DsbA family protein [Solirubrobacteraceae bacterium]
MASALPSPAGAFYFDLASPLAYLAAERALQALPGVEWRPVLAAKLPRAETFEAFRCGDEAGAFREDVERRAAQLGLQPLRWPEPFPFDSALAMNAATYAASIGRGVPFAQAAFRQAFAGGRSLAIADNVLIAAAACEMHPRAVLAAMQREAVGEQLLATTQEAARAGVGEVPAVVVGAGRGVFEGELALEQASAAIGAGAKV